MAKKSLEPLTEPMFYVLMCFHHQDMCGSDISDYVRQITQNRVKLGPGTLYSILSTFQSLDIIDKVTVEGRKITYSITDKGDSLYLSELNRLKSCLEDASKLEEDNENNK